MPSEAGIAIYVRADTGKLAIARIYDDSDTPLTAHGWRPSKSALTTAASHASRSRGPGLACLFRPKTAQSWRAYHDCCRLDGFDARCSEGCALRT
jgi:hypothetical protein